jgi:hypothetical protein
MTTELIVTLENRPGTLAELCETLGLAGVNIEAIAGMAVDDHGLVHLVADDSDRAATALQSAGIGYTTREVLSIQVLDEPGTLADVARVMHDADINIDIVYVTTGGRLILGVDDLDGAIQVASGLNVYR